MIASRSHCAQRIAVARFHNGPCLVKCKVKRIELPNSALAVFVSTAASSSTTILSATATTPTNVGMMAILRNRKQRDACGVDRYFSSAPSKEDAAELKKLLEEASRLSRSLFRICIRSVRVIRVANEFDEREFQKREEKEEEQLEALMAKRDGNRGKKGNEEEDDPRLVGLISMLPPVDREDELRSRANYYSDYARQNFFAESDCLQLFTEEYYKRRGAKERFCTYPHQRAALGRYLQVLRRGEEHRQWLLGDMHFDDPYRDSFDHEAVDALEKAFVAYIRKQHGIDGSGEDLYDHDGDRDDDFLRDSDDESEDEDDQ